MIPSCAEFDLEFRTAQQIEAGECERARRVARAQKRADLARYNAAEQGRAFESRASLHINVTGDGAIDDECPLLDGREPRIRIDGGERKGAYAVS